MELLNLARQFVQGQDDKHQQDLTSPPFELKHWIARIEDCKTYHDIYVTVLEFSQWGCWTLGEKSAVSSAYTPLAVKLLKNEEDMYRRLEDLEALCWKVG